MESTHLLGTGSRKRVKIHPHAVTAQYSAPPPFPPPRPPAAAPLPRPLPRPGDEGYDEAPSFEDFGSFLDETSDRRRLTGGAGRRWAGPTLFGGGGGGGKEGSRDTPLKASPASGAEEEGGVRGFGGGGGGGGGVGEQLASFGEASASASRLTWAGLLASALASGIVAVLTRLASDRFGLGPLFLLLVRSALQLSSLAVPLRRGEPAFGPPGHRLRLALYGAAYSLSLCCAYASLAFVSPDDAALATWRLATTALSATLAFLLLDERLGLADGAAAAGGVCGLGLALVPDMGVAAGGGTASPEEASARFWRSAFGWSLSAMAGLWMALALVGYRSMKERVGVAAALFAVSWTGCLAAAASMALLPEGAAWPSGAPAWLLLLGLAACAAAAFLGVTHALARIHPALVSASQSAEVPAAALLQMAVLPAATAPSAWALAGGAVVTASVGWLVAVKLRPSRGGGAGRRQREEYEEILDSPVK